jgi:hypothetical protein
MKTLMDKKVNKVAKALNRQLRQDVFKDRFEVKQYQKQRHDGIDYYLYQLIDNVEPERNQIQGWLSGVEITLFHKLYIEMNNFIINSSFWKTYRDNQ